MIKCMKMLENLSRDINPLQKQRLYRCCTLSIALYSFQLQYYNKAPLNYLLNTLQKMQHIAALWISGAFRTSPAIGIKAISNLVLIYLHLKKLYDRFLLRDSLLPSNHIITSILGTNGSYEYTSHNISIDNLTPKQRLHLNSLLIDMDNRCNKLFPSFSAFDKEFNLGNQLIDSFPD